MIKTFLKRYWPYYLCGLVFLVLSSWLQLFSPRILGEVVDLLSAPVVVRTLVIRGIWEMLLFAVLAFATKFIWRYLLQSSARKMECQIREDLFAKLQRLSVQFYHRRKTGDLMAYAINDINAIRMTFGPAMAQLASGISLGAISIYNMVLYGDSRLVIGALVPVFAAVAAIAVLGTQIRSRFLKVQQTFSEVSDRMQESISGIRVVKAYAQEEKEIESFGQVNLRMRDVTVKMVRVSSMLGPIVQACFGISYAVSLIYGSELVLEGQITLGDFVAFQGYLASIVMPVMSISRIINLYQRGLASWNRLTDILNHPEDVIDRPLPQLKEAQIEGGIDFNNLTFSYPMQQTAEQLKNIDLHLKPGETLGVLGSTGSGKTTLIKLLLRQYDAPEGSLTVDGHDIAGYSLETLRGAIGYVPQDDYLFSASIRENLLMFEEEGDEELINRVLEVSQMKDTIDALPDKLDTLLGERGVNLSGGQKQRLSIARALLRRPKILIFDDSLSAVDTNTEQQILHGLSEVIKDTTTIIIAHRVSAVRHADKIVVLDKGKIIECGSHDELLEKKGYYYKLCLRQMSLESLEEETGKEVQKGE